MNKVTGCISTDEKKQYGTERWAATLMLTVSRPGPSRRDVQGQAAGLPEELAKASQKALAATAPSGQLDAAHKGASEGTPKTRRNKKQLTMTPEHKLAWLEAKEERRKLRIARHGRTCHEILDLPHRAGSAAHLSRLRREREKLAFGHELNPSAKAAGIATRTIAASELEALVSQCCSHLPVLDNPKDFRQSVKRLLSVFRFLKIRLSKVELHTLRNEAEAVQLELNF